MLTVLNIHFYTAPLHYTMHVLYLQTTQARDLRYASTVSFERRQRDRDTEQLTQEKLLAADQRKQDEENRPRTYVLYSVCMALCVYFMCFYTITAATTTIIAATTTTTMLQ